MAGCRPRHQGERHGWEWGCSPGHHDADDGDDGDDADADGVVDDDDNDDDDDVNGGNFHNRREEEGANPLIFHNEFATWMEEPTSLYKQ